MDLSENGAQLIADFEGKRLTRYNDPVGHCTVGIGHLLHRGFCDGREGEFDLGSDEEAWALLISDCRKYAAGVERYVTAPLNQNQFDALVSFAYNLGAGIFAGAGWVDALNAGDYAAVGPGMLQYVYASGRVLPGLQRRREAEVALFYTPAADDLDVGAIFSRLNEWQSGIDSHLTITRLYLLARVMEWQTGGDEHLDALLRVLQP